MRHVPTTLIRVALALPLGILLAIPATAAAATPAAPTSARLQIVDLGTLGEQFTTSEARAVNQRGQIVGDSFLAGLGPEHAFLWSNGSMRDLGTLGGLTSDATDINDRGQVVGVSATAAGEQHAFLWADGSMRDLGTLGGATSVAQAINDRGQVLGTSDTATEGQHVFLWEHGSMRDLGLPPGTTANDLNEHGQLTGGHPAYRLERGHLVELQPDDPSSEGFAINERGEVAGLSVLPVSFQNHAFLWSGGRATDLGTLGGGFSVASGINDPGVVVGQATTADGSGRGFVWRHGVMTDLGVIAAGGINGSKANDINNRGWIVGGSDVANGDFHAVLWR
jgi:probable HAF family extracellular repeat protein